MTRKLTMSQLTTELTDFLGLAEDLDLPPVHSIQCKRTHKTGWSVTAWVAGAGDSDAYEAMAAWAALAGGSVDVGRPYAAPSQPSGMQRTLTVRIVVAEVPIELNSAVDGLFTVAETTEAVAR